MKRCNALRGDPVIVSPRAIRYYVICNKSSELAKPIQHAQGMTKLERYLGINSIQRNCKVTIFRRYPGTDTIVHHVLALSERLLENDATRTNIIITKRINNIIWNKLAAAKPYNTKWYRKYGIILCRRYQR